jgi:hypothetical protein
VWLCMFAGLRLSCSLGMTRSGPQRQNSPTVPAVICRIIVVVSRAKLTIRAASDEHEPFANYLTTSENFQ